MAVHSVTIELQPGRSITVETGKMALLAGGAVTVRQGDTIVLCAACSAAPRMDIDFFPLQVDYREKFSAAGRFPGGYFKREGRPTEKEILTARMTDRPLRPLFPKGYYDDVQIQCLLLSADGTNEPDVLSIFGAAAAVAVSDLPVEDMVGALRVGRVKGQFIANPTHAEMAESDLDLVYSGVADKVIMIEGGGDEISEETLRDAMAFANEVVKKQVAALTELTAKGGKAKRQPELHLIPEPYLAAVRASYTAQVRQACQIPGKEERNHAFDLIAAEAVKALAERFASDPDAAGNIKKAVTDVVTDTMRALILDESIRMDGRKLDQVRPLAGEVGLLPRTHGSALFARGETQVLSVTTLGSEGDSQDSDAITGGPGTKNFYLHYNFPNFSVGETGRIGAPGRREIGHGALAERSIARVMPKADVFPYAVRIVSEVMGSNGSTSMGSVCGASLSLMDAGVPLKKAVAGISCGLITRGEQAVLITDIIGSEDHYGDMDFKVAGTRDGITGFQLDLKIRGISLDMLYQAMLRNKTARLQILDFMGTVIDQPRAELNPLAPRLHLMRINPEKIGALIGPGGKVIRGITDTLKVQIDIEDDGTVKIYADNGDALRKAIAQVEAITAEVEIGKIYRGVVKTIKEFGAFVEILPGQEGMVHISELADYRVRQVEDVCQVGEPVTVKVIDIDERGRIRLSRREALRDLG